MDKTKINEILRPKDAAEQDRQEERVRARFWDTLKRAGRHIPFMEDLVAGYYCALDPKTPLRVRGTLLAALAYFVLPFDFVPDFIAVVGFTDDITVLATAIAAIRTHMTDAHYAAARDALGIDDAPDGETAPS